MNRYINSPMRWMIAAALVLSVMVAGAIPQGAQAGTTAPKRVASTFVQGYANATAAQTFATTSYADLAAATVSYTPIKAYNQTEAPGTPAFVDYIKVTWSADVIKATTTTGTCAVYVNGAILALSARTVDVAAKQNAFSGIVFVANSTLGTQTIKLQCKSGDTAVFTVNQANLLVEEVVL